MACTTFSRPRSSDTTTTDGRIRGPTSLPLPPGSRKLVVMKVEPSYLSSDLFTPFAEPRSTLPSIAEFVRPSYSRDRAWGTAKSSYGGVGPACQEFTESGYGSISRSHRHYGSGCINYCYHGDELGNGTSHRSKKLQVRDELSLIRHCRRSDKDPRCEKEQHVSVSSGTAMAIKEVQASLYGTSSYNRDFASIAYYQKHPSLPTLVNREVVRRSTDMQNKSTSHQEQGSLTDELCQEVSSSSKEKEQAEIDATGCDDSNNNGSEIELATSDTFNLNSATHGHMICTTDGTNALPDHLIITDLSELPSHFRRVTTKYTRNRCHLFPCRVPFYLWRKHHLLSSVLTSLPSKDKKDKEKNSYEEGCSKTAGCNHGDNTGTKLPQLEHMVTRKQPVGRAKMVTLTPHEELIRGMKGHVKRPSHLIQHLGVRFMTDAHTRYHSLFPDAVPNFHTVKPSKRHTFFGYHTSTFRG